VTATTSDDTASSTTATSTASTETATSTPASTDTTPPVVTLNGQAAMQINQGDTFTDPGATATDSVDGDITSKIVETGSVNNATAGLYTLTYSVTDSAGNTGSASRVVTVLASTSSPQVAAPAPVVQTNSTSTSTPDTTTSTDSSDSSDTTASTTP
jgi:hypothetical protein